MATANEDEYISIDGVPMSTPAWLFPPLRLYASAPVRHSHVTVPFRAYAHPVPNLPDAMTVSLQGRIFGARDSDGNLHANRGDGLLANLDELAAVLQPVQDGDGTVPVVWHIPGATNREGRGQVITALDTRPRGVSVMVATFDLWLPDGPLTVPTP